MHSIIPPFLQPGDTIGITASARWISPEQLQPALDIIEHWGFKYHLAPGLFNRFHQFAGTDSQRAGDLQSMIDNKNIKAILFARGGYGSVRIVDQVDFSSLMRNPKWICGYSDITVFHNRLSNLGIASIHSTMPISFPEATNRAVDSLRMALSGDLHKIEWNHTDNVAGAPAQVTGRLVGGNLSVLYSLMGSKDQLSVKDDILFLEDVDEMLYHLDRMMMNLGRAGLLSHLETIVVGGMTLMKDNTSGFGFPTDNEFGFEPAEIIGNLAAGLGIPVLTGFPAGHQSDNCAFYLGRQVEIETMSGKSILSYL